MPEGRDKGGVVVTTATSLMAATPLKAAHGAVAAVETKEPAGDSQCMPVPAGCRAISDQAAQSASVDNRDGAVTKIDQLPPP